MKLEDLLVRHGVVDHLAVEDPEGYDGGETLRRIREAEVEYCGMSAAVSVLTTENAELNAKVIRLKILCETVHDRLLRGDEDMVLLEMLRSGWK